jgi:hypothetical protein
MHYFRLRDKGKYGFILPPQYIVPSGEEAYAGLMSLVDFIGGTADNTEERFFW